MVRLSQDLVRTPVDSALAFFVAVVNISHMRGAIAAVEGVDLGQRSRSSGGQVKDAAGRITGIDNDRPPARQREDEGVL
jgi:hypothetical protein